MRYVQHVFSTEVEAREFARSLDRPINTTRHCQMILPNPEDGSWVALIRDNGIDYGPNVQRVDYRLRCPGPHDDCREIARVEVEAWGQYELDGGKVSQTRHVKTKVECYASAIVDGRPPAREVLDALDMGGLSMVPSILRFEVLAPPELRHVSPSWRDA